MNTQLRLVFFIVLSALMVLGYQYYYMPQPPAPDASGQVVEGGKTAPLPGTAGNKAGEQSPERVTPSLPPSSGSIADSISYLNKSEGKDKCRVRTELVDIEFSKSEGYITSAKLKKFKGDDGNDLALISGSKFGALIFSGAKADAETGTINVPEKYEFIGRPDTVIAEGGTGEVLFKGTAGGVDIEKKFIVSGAGYSVDMILTYRNRSEAGAEIYPQILTGPGFYKDGLAAGRTSGHSGPIIAKKDGVVLEEAAKLKSPKIYTSDVEWGGFETKYFLGCIKLPDRNATVGIYPTGIDDFVISIDSGSIKLKPLETRSIKYSFYLGPKEYKTLEKMGFEKAVDFGWFGVLGKPLLVALNWIYTYLGNYGLSIIIITIFIKILFLPLTQKSFNSMQKMKTIQPQMKAIRERYKSDAQKMNQEMMLLYKQHGVNPLGGCLPMLLQIPVFIAFYNVLLNAIELRGATFFLWIKDLSDKDPYYITPIIMGVTMLVQQKMTPSAGDPRQQQIMMIMPVIFTFMFMSFPVGLVIYWTVNNLLTIGQQYFMTDRKDTPKEDEGASRSSRKRRKTKKLEDGTQK
ncbi:MAG: membrane protein insertase YidC [Candidatus Schekmanbacteria bacterium]|nr:membrane protein insertase YidC [Candidatus Schekmanbacteria bacterium]